jgi:predicted esterase YcpF (UPF0227 family)
VAVCARAVLQPDGSFYLALDPTVTDLSTCAYVVEDGASNAWRELGNLSLENSQVIGVSVGLVWAVAWGFKMIIRSINLNPESDS